MTNSQSPSTAEVDAAFPTSADPEGIALINVFEIGPEEVDAFIEGWTERARILSQKDGFLDSRLHRALSRDGRFQLVNIAHWDNAKSYAAARTDPKFQASRERIAWQTPKMASNVDLYEVVGSYVVPPSAEGITHA